MTKRETSEQWFARWAARDWDGCVDLVDDEIVVTDHGRDVEYRGKAGARAFIDSYVTKLDPTFEGRVDLIETTDTVVAQFVSRVRHVAEFDGAAATGREAVVPMLSVLSYGRRGRMIGYEQYGDNAALMAQLAGGERVTPAMFRAGEVIIQAGDPADRFFVLRAGVVDVNRGGRSVDTMGAGQFFGERGLLTGEPRNATVTALIDTQADVIDARGFHDQVMANREVAAVLTTAARRRSDRRRARPAATTGA